MNKACDVIMGTATVTEQEPEADTEGTQEYKERPQTNTEDKGCVCGLLCNRRQKR